MADKINLDDTFPYNAIKDVTIDGQAMIWYPKTYVRALELPETAQYAGKYAWQISEFPQEGFHVHRAFIDSSGKERDGFYLGKYEASNQSGVPGSIAGATPWVNINTPTAIAACKKRNTDASNDAKTGWHIENCFEYWYVSLLMLIDLGNADTYTAIGAGGQGSLQKCGSTNAVWRGLYEHWANVWEIVDGCKMDGNGIVQIWDTTGETYVSTGKKLADSGIARGSGTGYDLSDTFIPAADGKGSSFSATTSDGVWTGSNTVTYLGGGWSYGSSDGAFTFFGGDGASSSYAGLGFRLAKW